MTNTHQKYIPSSARLYLAILLTPVLVSSLFLPFVFLDSIFALVFVVALFLTVTPALILCVPMKMYLSNKPLSYFKSLLVCLFSSFFASIPWLIIMWMSNTAVLGEGLITIILFLIGGVIASPIFYFISSFSKSND